MTSRLSLAILLTISLVILGLMAINGVFNATEAVPRIRVGPPAAPASQEMAIAICERHATQFTFVSTPTDSYYEAKYDVLNEPRFDLTWRPNGTVVAVERTDGRTFDAWAEQIDDQFLRCISTREFTVKQAAH